VTFPAVTVYLPSGFVSKFVSPAIGLLSNTDSEDISSFRDEVVVCEYWIVLPIFVFIVFEIVTVLFGGASCDSCAFYIFEDLCIT